MTKEVVTGNQTPQEVQRSARSAKGYPTYQLLFTIAFSFLAGAYFTNGIRHLRAARNEHDWVSDFFFSVVWLTFATIAGVRTLKATRPAASQVPTFPVSVNQSPQSNATHGQSFPKGESLIRLPRITRLPLPARGGNICRRICREGEYFRL